MSTNHDAWNARQHTVVTGRTRKGRTTQRVTHHGRASVIGALDADVNGSPLLATVRDEHTLHPSSAAARLLVAAMERGEISRTRVGLSSFDLERICREAYGELLPPVLGTTEHRQYEQVIHQSRSEHAENTRHVCDIDGGREHDLQPRLVLRPTRHADGSYSVTASCDPTAADIAQYMSANRPQTQTLAPWPTRGTSEPTVYGRLPMARRDSDPNTRKVFRVASDGTCERVVIVVTATDVLDETGEPCKVFDGFDTRDRQPAIVRTETARAERTDLTTVDVGTLPTSEDGWRKLIARVESRGDFGLVTITRGKLWRSTDRRGPVVTYHQARTPEGLAHKLAS